MPSAGEKTAGPAPTGSASVVVTGAGIVSPLGYDAASTTAAARGGVSRFMAIPEFATTTGAGAAGAIAKELTDGRSGTDRLLALAIPAMQEALFGAEGFCDDLDLGRADLVLGLAPVDRPSYGPFEESDLADLLEACEADPLGASVVRIHEGQTAGLRAIGAAIDRLRAGDRACCVAGAFDSLLDYPVLDALDRGGRLKTDDRAVGLLPGEAAAFIVLETAESASVRGARPLARIVSLGFAPEEAPLASGRPSRAVGLTLAVKGALDGAGPAGGRIDEIFTDLNGEPYRMREWAVAQSRVLGGNQGRGLLRHPADCFGDVGAAAGVVLVAMAITMFGRGWSAGPHALVWCSSDGGDRAALVVSAPDAPGAGSQQGGAR